MWATLAWQSLLHRRFTVILTFIALLISVSLLFAIEHIRVQTKDNFKRTISGVDLVVAGRSSQINVLLSSVFRMGANPNTLSWKSYQEISQFKNVQWSIPLSLGDTFQGYPVVGTSLDYFEHYQFGRQQALSIHQGRLFATPNEVVIGASVAKQQNLQVGSEVVLSHGSGKVSFSHHEHHPFVVSGILQATGTPVDKSLHVPLIAIDEMHKPAAPVSAFGRPAKAQQSNIHTNKDHADHDHDHDHDQQLQALPVIEPGAFDLIGSPRNISAFLLKVDSPLAILTMQRDLNRYQKEAISAIIPGLALAELWQILGSVERILQVVAMLVLIASLIALATMLLASMHQRQSEIAVLRAIGASPAFIASLIQAEALVIAALAIVSAYALVSVSIYILGDWLLAQYGVFVAPQILSMGTLSYAGIILLLSAMVALVPTIMAYQGAKKLFA